VPKNNLMPIGQFSNACRLSIKALRHYDERGLLKPAFVDPATGYRYYRPEQARDAVMIALLRSLEVPLDTIGNMLSAEGDELRRYLDTERARIERDLTKKRHALHSIERIARHGDLMPYTVAVRSAPGYRLASIHCNTTAERMVEDSGNLMYRLFDELAGLGAAHGDPYMCINHAPDRQGNIVVHACVGLAGKEIQNGRVTMMDIDGGPEA
jgi:DNA-binding transcriptional MerR regulator